MATRKLIFVTYADGTYERNLRWNGLCARIFLGADKTFLFRRDDLESSDTYHQHSEIFDAPRGAGYWAWKPYFILRALHEAQPGDIVIYHDCGFGFRYKSFLRPRRILNLLKNSHFVAGVRMHQYGPNRRWCHKACFELMTDGSKKYLDAPITEAAVSFWVCSEPSKAFVSEWLNTCLNIEAIGDVSNNERAEQDSLFKEHRHDQAILTNLVISNEAQVLCPSPAAWRYAKSISMLELDLRARSNPIYKLLFRVIVRLSS